jgi:ribosome-binding protein aMBF1 (putative translation factor)
MTKSDRISRGRRLTPDEAAKYRAIRDQMEREKGEIAHRLQHESPGPGSWADLHELRSLVAALRQERDRRGLSREDVAARAGLEPHEIEDLEENRSINPTVSTLTRFAAAVGRHLMMGLAAGQPAQHGPQIAPLPDPLSNPDASQPSAAE